MAEVQFTQEERELLLTETAGVRAEASEQGGGVVLTKSGRTLCQCAEADARLIVKLFNYTSVPRPTL